MVFVIFRVQLLNVSLQFIIKSFEFPETSKLILEVDSTGYLLNLFYDFTMITTKNKYAIDHYAIYNGHVLFLQYSKLTTTLS